MLRRLRESRERQRERESKRCKGGCNARGAETREDSQRVDRAPMHLCLNRQSSSLAFSPLQLWIFSFVPLAASARTRSLLRSLAAEFPALLPPHPLRFHPL